MKILKFYTDTCCQCKQQSSILSNMEGIEIVPVNCDEEEELAAKYSVRSLPTLVVLDNEENVINKFIGVTPLNVITECLKDYGVKGEASSTADTGMFYKL